MNCRGFGLSNPWSREALDIDFEVKQKLYTLTPSNPLCLLHCVPCILKAHEALGFLGSACAWVLHFGFEAGVEALLVLLQPVRSTSDSVGAPLHTYDPSAWACCGV